MILQGNQGQIGKQLGQNITASFGEFSDLLVSELQPRYYEQAYRGNVFVAANQAIAAFSTAVTTNTGLTVANPPGSGKNLVLLGAEFLPTATLAVGQIAVGAQPYSATPVGGTAVVGWPKSTLIGSTPQGPSVASMFTTATLSATPFYAVWLNAVLSTTAGNFSGGGSGDVNDYAGFLIAPPGTALTLISLTAAQSGLGTLTWMEIPV